MAGGPYRLSADTLERWLAAFRARGIKGLTPRPRCDAGISRAVDPLLAERIGAIKKQSPHLSIPLLIQALEDEGEAPAGLLKHSTVHRLLQQRGLSGRPGIDPGRKQQRLPFRASAPMELWVADVMHARVSVAGAKAYLIAFMDNYSRAIMHAAFAFDEGALSLLRVFRQALLVRGIPRRAYADHGSCYVDGRFQRTCAHLGIHLRYAPVRDGAAKGCIERWFLTVRTGFEAFLQKDDLRDLSSLNGALWNWIHTTYHARGHSALDGDTPWQRFLNGLADIEHRRVEPGFDFLALWRSRELRTVRRDGTVSLHGHWLEVPPTVDRRRVELRYLKDALPEQVEVWIEGTKIGDAQPVDLAENNRRRRQRPRPTAPTENRPAVDPLGRARRRWSAES